MAPIADDDYDGGPYDGDYPRPGVTKLPPTVVTSTYTKNAQTTAIAYLVGSWIDDDGFLHSWTITEFNDLGTAATVAAGIGAAPSGAMPTDGWDADEWESIWAQYYSGFASLPATTSATEYYQQQAPPSTPTPSTPYTPAQTGSSPSESPQNQKPQKPHDGPPITALAVGIIVPIIVCILTIVACICCVSHCRRKARRAQAGDLANRMSSEMRQVPAPTSAPKPPGLRVANDERAYLAPPASSAPAMAAGAAVAGVGASAVAAGAMRSEQEPPVILSTTMNNGFFTGIDTSDAVSLSDARSMASHDTFGEEPPPPYRPRSVPPISRETSVRTSIMSGTPNRNSSIRSGHRQTLSSGSIIRRSNEVRSPFDDPEEDEEDDDNLSDISTIRGSFTGSRETERLNISRSSTVDSYHDSPTNSRPNLR